MRFDQPWLFAGLLVLAVAASATKMVLPLGRSQSNLSLSHAVNFWALFSLGAPAGAVIAAISAWAQCTLRVSARNPLHRTLFSIGSLTLTVAIAGLALPFTMEGDRAGVSGLIRSAALVAPLYFFVNSALVAGAIALATRQHVGGVWHRNFLWSSPSYLAGAALAAVAAGVTARGWFGWLALLAVPFYLVFRSYHTVVARLREEHDSTQRAMEVQLATIEALALAIEAKAGCTPEHIRSIQQCAAMLAEAAGLSDIDVQAVRTAALLHDVGNMAVPEHILSKPEALTPEEFERVKIHPRVGADILRDVPFGSPVSELVLCHHERWDGLGYPSGLRGEAIPLGARILAIADCYSTLQTTRPYRPARTAPEAVAVLREFAGSAYDPSLIDLFIAGLETAAAAAGQGVVVESAWVEAPSADGLQDIAGAHREEHTLYEIAQALGSSLGVTETMALIEEKVSRLVPLSTCALFLGNDTAGYECRYAHGLGTEALLKWTPKSWSDLALRLPACADGRGAHGEEIAALLPCPLTFEGQLIGGIVIYHTEAGAFTDEHRRILERVSDQAAAVIYNSTRFEQTQHDSHTDPLTDLANRRSLDRQFEIGLELAAREGSTASVIVLDLDRLKEINDTYGHEAGDRALRAVGAVLQSTVRQTDLCARFAGDEFVVVLWDCNPEHEARRVQELQNAIGVYPFEPRPGVRVSLSISAGPARLPADGQTFEELLAVADERMYTDKAARRARGTTRSAAAQGERA
ncbi:MAG TPA: HD domain-containing phosphohydrolase [Vicinamibacterales bacterium]|nr:HD domain-containing phosphohydrolase [Vicinamibacterales bacterium]